MEPFLLRFGFASPEGASDSGIVGGKEAKPHSRPYMASLQVGKDHTCGGILIRQDFVLTSLHCSQLKRAAVLNKYVRPIELPKKGGRIRDHLRCAVAGWGRTGEDLPASKVLKEATEETLSRFKSDTGGPRLNVFCLQGDSGGPLLCNNKLRGLMAFTVLNKCSHDEFPHVFMKVSFFVPWIQSVMQRF
uniref:Peptidase S1 domain-containing protein n=1 Tax=Takifugu rubripes TaxID=31033 RepID=A0A3B5JZN7_TAKRU